MKHNISTFYKFIKLENDQIENIKKQLEINGEKLGIKGLILLGPEGVNATISGSEVSIVEFKKIITESFSTKDFFFKDSFSDNKVFNLFKVKVRDEIVTIGRPDLVPITSQNCHLDPDEWDEKMKDPNTVVVDTRNTYETNIGKFKNAIDLEIDDFQEFSSKLSEFLQDKSKQYLIYCTGGIRCEKAILSMNEMGYENVYQLNGGIINYFDKKGSGNFEGECFVFDHRVAVKNDLSPSEKYKLCPHCGQPGSTSINCLECKVDSVVCGNCLTDGLEFNTCSKNCRYHYNRKGNKIS